VPPFFPRSIWEAGQTLASKVRAAERRGFLS
jgi:hypothetical protein